MSNTIYSAILPVISKDKNKFNFVYQITELSTGIKYIGSHGTEKSDPIKDLKKYKSSTLDTCFKLNQKLNPLNYYYEILSYHSTRDDATLEESRLHFLYDVKCNPKYYNRSNQTHNGFSVAGYVTVKDKDGNTSSVLLDDPRYLSGELVHIQTKTVAVKDKDGNNFLVKFDNERYLSGELVGVVFGKVVVRDEYGNIFQVNIDDERYKLGKLTHINKGKAVVKDNENNILHVNVDNEDYLSGKYQHINKGKAVVKDKSGNIFQIDVDDERLLSGEYVGIAKGKTCVKDKSGNIKYVSTNDPEYLSNDLSHINKRKAVVKDKSGNIFQIDVDDERIKNGSLIGITGYWCQIDNIIYSKIEASIKFNISETSVYNRCKSSKFPSWKFIK